MNLKLNLLKLYMLQSNAAGQMWSVKWDSSQISGESMERDMNYQIDEVTTTDDDGIATGKSFREQMKEKCIEYMDQARSKCLSFVRVDFLLKTCARGPALLVTGEWDSMFNTVGNSAMTILSAIPGFQIMCAIMSGIATIACLNLVSDEYCKNLPDDSVTFS